MMETVKYEQVEHTADIALRIYGKSLEDLFRHGAEGLFEQIGTCSERENSVSRKMFLQAASLEDLFHDWLAELNFLHQLHHEIYYDFKIQLADQKTLDAEVSGTGIDPNQDSIELEIKAVTYHHLEVKETEQGWQAFVIFDI